MYATPDPVFATFFAALDRQMVWGMGAGDFGDRSPNGVRRRRHSFSVDAESLARGRWRDGVVYAVAKDTFPVDQRFERKHFFFLWHAQSCKSTNTVWGRNDDMSKARPPDRVRIRPAVAEDASAMAEIYNQGIEDRTATFEVEPRSAEERRAWLRSLEGRFPAIVAEAQGIVVGWAALGPYSPRSCYRGIGEGSLYVRREWRGCGIGDRLLGELITHAEELGFWKLVGRVFPHNRASRALCQKHGFREVGIHEKHAKLDGQWLDVVVVERLIPANLT